MRLQRPKQMRISQALQALASEYRQEKLDEETFKSKKLQARNRALQDEITDLKQGNKVVEELARSELGMVKKDEVFYRVIPKETQDQKRR